MTDSREPTAAIGGLGDVGRACGIGLPHTATIGSGQSSASANFASAAVARGFPKLDFLHAIGDSNNRRYHMPS